LRIARGAAGGRAYLISYCDSTPLPFNIIKRDCNKSAPEKAEEAIF